MEIKNLEKIDEIKKKELRGLKILLLLCFSTIIILCFIVSKIPTDSFKTTVFLMIVWNFLPIMFYCSVFLHDLSANKSKYDFWKNIENCKLKTIKSNGMATIEYQNNFDKNKKFTYDTTWIIDSAVTEVQYDIQKDLIILPLSNV